LPTVHKPVPCNTQDTRMQDQPNASWESYEIVSNMIVISYSPGERQRYTPRPVPFSELAYISRPHLWSTTKSFAAARIETVLEVAGWVHLQIPENLYPRPCPAGIWRFRFVELEMRIPERSLSSNKQVYKANSTRYIETNNILNMRKKI